MHGTRGKRGSVFRPLRNLRLHDQFATCACTPCLCAAWRAKATTELPDPARGEEGVRHQAERAAGQAGYQLTLRSDPTKREYSGTAQQEVDAMKGGRHLECLKLSPLLPWENDLRTLEIVPPSLFSFSLSPFFEISLLLTQRGPGRARAPQIGPGCGEVWCTPAGWGRSS